MKKFLILILLFSSLIFANQKDKWQSDIPDIAFVYKKMGVEALKKRDLDRAIIFFKNAIQNKKDYYLAYYNLAIAYYLKKDLNKSYNSLKKAFNIAKKDKIKDINIYILYGYANMISNREDEAKRIYEEGLKLDKNNSKLLNNYGLLLFRKGEYKKAKEYFKKSLEQGYFKAKKNIEMIDKIIEDINRKAKDSNITDSNIS